MVVSVISFCDGQELSSICEESNGTVYWACFSEPQHVFRTSEVNVTIEPENMTCGTPLSYFRPPGYDNDNDICDDSDPEKQHLPRFMVDDDQSGTWWQSVTWPPNTANSGPPEVAIRFSFKKLYELAGDFQIIFKSGRPKKMSIEKSRDNGQTWKTWQVYSARDCTGYPRILTKDNASQVICTRQYSGKYPISGGIVLFSAMDRYSLFLGPDLSNYVAFYDALDNTDLQSFLTFSDIRIKLTYPGTDGKEIFGNQQDFLKYYYAISDVKLVARCFCYQHASLCYDGPNGTSLCQCKHNTAGVNCESCLPLYNNKPWRPGSYHPYPKGTANECVKCQCNDHADSCTFSSIYGKGICDNCTHNTTGQECEECITGYYRNTTVELNSPDVCIECDCEGLGVQPTEFSCRQTATPSLPVGQCFCKPLVTGRRCDTCVSGFYGLLLDDRPGECKNCGCKQYGTLGNSQNCDPVDGQCPCKVSTMGRACDHCKEGYYNFPTGLPKEECVSCACDPGGSQGPICKETDGSCECRPHILGIKCVNVEVGYYVPAIDEQVFQPTAGSPSCRVDGDKLTDNNPFDGEAIATCTLPAQVEFEAFSPKQQRDVVWPYFSGVRYTLNTTGVEINGTLSISVTGETIANLTSVERMMNMTIAPGCTQAVGSVTNVSGVLTPGIGEFVIFGDDPVPLDMRCTYSLKLDLSDSTAPIMLDSVVILPDAIGVVQVNTSTDQTNYQLYDRAEDPPTVLQNYRSCLPQLAALNTQRTTQNSLQCGSLAFAISTEVYNGAIPCDCDPTGTVAGGTLICESTGGQCPCKNGVGGRRCDRCIPGFFLFSETGCTACECQEGGSWNGACDQKSGQCSCLPNIANVDQDTRNGMQSDRKCSACVTDYWGYGNRSGCSPCDCNTAGSNGTLCNESGQCPCKATIDGLQCDRCQLGYFGFSPDGCKQCNCTVEGSSVDGCGQAIGNCTCKENVEGDNCELCKSGYFGLSALNPDGCQPCFCYGHGGTCNSATGFIQKSINAQSSATWTRVNGSYVQAPSEFLGNQLYAYGNSLVFHLKSTVDPVTAKDTVAVILEGNDGSQVYSAPTNFTIGNLDYSNVQVVLHHNYWRINESTTPLPQDMYKLMSDLGNLYIRFLYASTVVDIMNVTLITAEQSNTSMSDSISVSGVESCTCNSDDFVDGNSCEKCKTGYRRIGYENGTLYDKCDTCDCTSRGETTPPECDEVTGICMNCRNGTMGDHCELCAPHVVGEDCTECNDTYWGMTQEGCKECNCSEPGSKNNICSKTDGQCECAANIVNRTCDICQESFFNLTETGCIECPECYNLVMDIVNDLRSEKNNVTDYVINLEELRNNDSQPFLDRLQDTMDEFQDLLDFLSQISSKEGEIWSKLNPLKTTANSLEDRLKNDTIPLANLAHVNLMTMAALFQNMTKFQEQISKTASEVGNLEMGPVSDVSSAMSNLVRDLQHVQDTIRKLAGNATSDLQKLENTVQTIENITTQAIKDAESALQSVQSTQTQHQNTTRLISSMENQDVLLTGSIQGILQAVSAQNTTITGLQSTMMKVQTDLSALNQDTTDLSQLRSRASSLKEQAESLSSQATLGSTSGEGTVARVGNAVNRTKQLLGDLQTVRDQAASNDDLSLTTSQKTDNSTRRITDSFTQAEDMLETMQNFDTKAKAVEEQANLYLAEAEATMVTSQATIDKAKALRESLSQAQRNSALSTEAAQQGQAYAQLDFTSLKPVADKATELRNSTQSLINDIEATSHIPNVSNSTIQGTLDQCMAQQKLLDNLTSDADSIQTLATNISDAVDSTQQRAQRVLNDIQNIAQLDVTDILGLQSQVVNLRKEFTASQLATAIQTLQTKLAEKQAWVTTMKAKKLEITQELEKLRNLRTSNAHLVDKPLSVHGGGERPWTETPRKTRPASSERHLEKMLIAFLSELPKGPLLLASLMFVCIPVFIWISLTQFNLYTSDSCQCCSERRKHTHSFSTVGAPCSVLV
ncbi:hypothetical protein ScPMuIL_011011 [Solemya velum]